MSKLLKKGISPLIATVLVIGFTVALAAVILTWGTTFTKSIAKGTEESTEIQLTCAQDVQIDVKAACLTVDALGAPNGVQFIVENNGNKDIANFSVRLKVTDTNILAGNVPNAPLSKFGLQTYTVEAGNDAQVPGLSAVAGPTYNIDHIQEVTLLPVVRIAGKEVTCAQSIDSYAPAVEGTFLNLCEQL